MTTKSESPIERSKTASNASSVPNASAKAKPVAVQAHDGESIPKIFMRKLREAESAHQVKELAALFIKDALLENLTRPVPHRHSAGAAVHRHSAEAFWRQYLTAFESIESHFTHVTDDGKTAVLEWHSSGKLATGSPVDYAGVSVLEYSGGLIEKFRTYYDSAALLPHATKSERSFSQSVGKPEINVEAGS